MGCVVFVPATVAIGVSVGELKSPSASSVNSLVGVDVGDGDVFFMVGVSVLVGVTVGAVVDVGVFVGVLVGADVAVASGTSIVTSYESLGELLDTEVYLLIRNLYAPGPEYSVAVGLPICA